MRFLLCLVLAVAYCGCLGNPAQAHDLLIGLKFPKSEHVYDDDWKEFTNSGNKYRRWIRQDPVAFEHADVNMDEHRVMIKDLSHWNKSSQPDLLKNGFEVVRLRKELLGIFEAIHESGLDGARVGPTLAEMTDEDGSSEKPMEEVLARSLQGFDTYKVTKYFTYNFRCAGFVIRKGGPLARPLPGDGFDQVAQRTHIDQDLEGEPLIRMGVQWVFKYLPFMHILNVWTPLNTPAMRPLGLADLETMSPTDILRYRANSTKNAGGRTGSFASDRLMALFNPKQEWWWDPTMEFGQAIVFLTGKTLHSSFSVPQEQILDAQLTGLLAIREGKQPLSDICEMWHEHYDNPLEKNQVPPHTWEMIENLNKIFHQICHENKPFANHDLDEIIKSVHRASLEIRCVTAVIPYKLLNFGGLVLVVLISFLCWRILVRNSSTNKYKTKQH